MSRPTHETASSLARRHFCPGSARMERGMLDQPTFDSQRGDRVHAALACRTEDNSVQTSSDAWIACNGEERECVMKLAEREFWAVQPYIASHGPPREIIRERRFVLPPDKFSAQLDVVYVWHELAIILDYKSSWGDVPDSAENHQLMGQMVAYRCDSPLAAPAQILVGIVQPKEPVSLARYGADDFEPYTVEVLRIIGETEAADAPLRPGEQQCKYCKAAHVCPALQEQTLALAIPMIHPDAEKLMSSQTLGDMLNACVLAERYVDACRSEARRRIAAGVPVPGWELEEGATKRTVTDPQKALEALTPFGLTVDAALSCMTMKVGELEKATARAAGWKGRDAKERFNAALEAAGCLEFKQNAPSLQRAVATH